MEGIQGGVASHLGETRLEPTVEFVTKYRPQVPIKVASLEEGGVGRDVVLSDDAAKEREGTYRAKERALIVLS